jgi:hypothetical protein
MFMRKVSRTIVEGEAETDFNVGADTTEADFTAIDLLALIISCAFEPSLIFWHETRNIATIPERLNIALILFIVINFV